MNDAVTLVSSTDTAEQVQEALTGKPAAATPPTDGTAATPPATPAAAEPTDKPAEDAAAAEAARVAEAAAAETAEQKAAREKSDGRAAKRIEKIQTEIAALTKTKHDTRRDVEAESAHLEQLRQESARLEAEIAERARIANGGAPAPKADGTPAELPSREESKDFGIVDPDEPRLEDTNDDGTPKFATYEDWNRAMVAYGKVVATNAAAREIARAREEEEIARRERIERGEAQRVTDEALALHSTNIEALRQVTPDFDATMEGVRDVILELVEEHGPKTMEIVDGYAVHDAENGAALLYHLAKNEDELREIVALPRKRQLIRLAKLDAKLATADSATSAKDGSDLGLTPPEVPDPIKPIGGGPTATTVSPEEEPYKAWRDRRNAEERARLGR